MDERLWQRLESIDTLVNETEHFKGLGTTEKVRNNTGVTGGSN